MHGSSTSHREAFCGCCLKFRCVGFFQLQEVICNTHLGQRGQSDEGLLEITDQFHPGQKSPVLIRRLHIYIDNRTLLIAVPDARVIFDRVEADADHPVGCI